MGGAKRKESDQHWKIIEFWEQIMYMLSAVE